MNMVQKILVLDPINLLLFLSFHSYDMRHYLKDNMCLPTIQESPDLAFLLNDKGTKTLRSSLCLRDTK